MAVVSLPMHIAAVWLASTMPMVCGANKDVSGQAGDDAAIEIFVGLAAEANDDSDSADTDFSYEIATENWSRFAGADWKIKSGARGRFGEKGENVVLLLQGVNNDLISENVGLGSPRLDNNPRKLLLLERIDNDWHKWGEFSGWLPTEGNSENPCLLDPLAGDSIGFKDGALHIDLNYLYICGSWLITNDRYRFRREGNRLRLIGMDASSFHRATHDERNVSTNFLTFRQEITEVSGRTEKDASKVEPDSATITRRITPKKWYFDMLDPEECLKAQKDEPAWCVH